MDAAARRAFAAGLGRGAPLGVDRGSAAPAAGDLDRDGHRGEPGPTVARPAHRAARGAGRARRRRVPGGVCRRRRGSMPDGHGATAARAVVRAERPGACRRVPDEGGRGPAGRRAAPDADLARPERGADDRRPRVLGARDWPAGDRGGRTRHRGVGAVAGLPGAGDGGDTRGSRGDGRRRVAGNAGRRRPGLPGAAHGGRH